MTDSETRVRKRTPKSCAHTERCALEDWINQLTLCLIKKSRFSFRKEQKSRCRISTYENAEALRAWTTSRGFRALTAATAFSLQRGERCDQSCPCKLNGRFTCCSRFARRSMERHNSEAFPGHSQLSIHMAKLVCATHRVSMDQERDLDVRRMAR